jgi:hypothetical protein
MAKYFKTCEKHRLNNWSMRYKNLYILFILILMNNLDFITSYALNFCTKLDKTCPGFHMLNTIIFHKEMSQMAIQHTISFISG